MLTEYVHSFANWAITTGGLPGAGFLMALESMIFPIPSEVVMPPLGMAVHQGQFPLWAAITATSIGSLVGSLISYYLGYFGGKPLVVKIGKFLLLNEHHLDLTTAWFKKWGSLTVFVSRFVPVVRHFISIPAGMAKMNILKFSLYTVIGATLWNSLLLYLGYIMEKNWESILTYRTPLDAAMVVLILIAIIAWYWMHLRKPKKASEPHPEG